MKPLVLICNTVSVVFTLLVLATDGVPTQAGYIGFTFLLILIPAFTLLAVARPGLFPAPTTTILRLAGICNLVLLAFVAWALADQYPHPNEPGFVPYAALMILTPILSALLLLRRHPGGRPQSHGLDR